MSYTAKYRHLTAQRAYARGVARRGLPALLAPYSVRPVLVVPSQRRRVVETERIGA